MNLPQQHHSQEIKLLINDPTRHLKGEELLESDAFIIGPGLLVPKKMEA